MATFTQVYNGTGGATSITFAMKVFIGYGEITRVGNHITVQLGMKIVPVGSGGATWCYNSVGGFYPTVNSSNLRYAFKSGGAHYCSPSDNLFCKAVPTPSNGYKNTTEDLPWVGEYDVNSTDETLTVTMYATWCQYDLTATSGRYYKVQQVSITIPLPSKTGNLIYSKVNGVWKQGECYVKNGTTWVLADTVYVKVNGEWKEAI